MPDERCSCCATTGEQESSATDTGNFQTATTERGVDVLDAALPADLQESLGRFFGREPVRTLGEWADAIRQQTDGGAISVEELCHAAEETGHWGEMDGERYHFACFYDAVVLAAMADEPVEIRTESPDGTVVEARAVGQEELTVSPSAAVFSVGVDETVVPADSEPSIEDSYAAICPYVKAFPDRAAYEQWAGSVSAATAAIPLAGATDLAEAVVAE